MEKGDIRECGGCGVELRQGIDSTYPHGKGKDIFCKACHKKYDFEFVPAIQAIYDKYDKLKRDEIEPIRKKIFGKPNKDNIEPLPKTDIAANVEKTNSAREAMSRGET